MINHRTADRISVASERRSLVNFADVQLSVCVSILFHVVLLLLLRVNMPLGINSFWLFLCTDIALWSLSLIAPIGLFRRTIVWYDPLFWLLLMLLPIGGGVFLAFMVHPSDVYVLVGYGSSIFRWVSPDLILWRLAQGQFIFFTFGFLVLIINRQPLDFQRKHPPDAERLAAILTGMVIVPFGIMGLVLSLPSINFAHAFTVLDNSVLKDAPSKYIMLQRLAQVALSLTLIGVFSPIGNRIRHRTIKIYMSIVTMSFFMPVILASGSRSSLFFSVLIPLVVLAHFRVEISKRVAVGLLGALAIAIGTITVVRLGNNLGGSQVGVTLSISALLDDISNYMLNMSRQTGPLLDLDRSTAVALILEHVSIERKLIWGESLIASPFNLFANYWSRLSGTGASVTLLEANEYIDYWRFGRPIDSWAVPPSIPGEYYMQFGWPSFYLLSIGFALFFRFLRGMAASSKTLFARWLAILVLMNLVQAISAETSVLTGVFFVYIPMVSIIYVALLVVTGRVARIDYGYPRVA